MSLTKWLNCIWPRKLGSPASFVLTGARGNPWCYTAVFTISCVCEWTASVMTAGSFPCFLPGCTIDQIEQGEQSLTIWSHVSSSVAIYPTCEQSSLRVPSSYARSPQDLPVGERRFRCSNPACSVASKRCRTAAKLIAELSYPAWIQSAYLESKNRIT